jgi:excisionase family DNA binding protein
MVKLWTVAELAKVWQVHPKSIYRMIAAEEIEVTRIGRSVRIPDEQAKKGCPRVTQVEAR